ncbi:hypothetical protein [Campylobacter troglodytis]|uniref:hypothetical protein n=1 Tax=Campylobacter troglodytis TaxID=654363 RepID=UPI00115ADE7B|nr:hypothetical protein [Campylobacter troglodytis]TQR57708.1 hypothetical protein DMC01_08475 [Campylobacter troglodytis]
MKKLLVATLVALFGLCATVSAAEPTKNTKSAKKTEEKSLQDNVKDAAKDKVNEKIDGAVNKLLKF